MELRGKISTQFYLNVILGIIVFSYFGFYLGLLFNPILYLSVLVIIGVIGFLLLETYIPNPSIQSNLVFLIISLLIILMFGVILNQDLTLAYLFLLTEIGMVLIFHKINVDKYEFLNMINKAYLLFVALSMITYVGLLPTITEKQYSSPILTSFDAFRGFFGSTAHIDAFSSIVFIGNIFIYKSKKWRAFLLVTSGLVAFLTLRTTPILIILGAFTGSLIIKWLKLKWLKVLAICVLFTSFLLPFLVYLIFKDKLVLLGLDYLLTGRASLWVDMIYLYDKKPLLSKLVGFATVEQFEVYSWGFVKANPHNFFLNCLIVYGVFGYVLIFFLVIRAFKKMEFAEMTILLGILLGGIGNSQVIYFTNFPLAIWFAYLIGNEQKN